MSQDAVNARNNLWLTQKTKGYMLELSSTSIKNKTKSCVNYLVPHLALLSFLENS